MSHNNIIYKYALGKNAFSFSLKNGLHRQVEKSERARSPRLFEVLLSE